MFSSIRPLTFGDLEVGETFKIGNPRGTAGPTVYTKVNARQARRTHVRNVPVDSFTLTLQVVREVEHATQ